MSTKDKTSSIVSSEHFLLQDCPICYETFKDTLSVADLEAGFFRERLQVGGCDHAFCRECLRTHCHHAVSSRDVPIPCPAMNCRNTLQETQVEDLLCPYSTQEENPTTQQHQHPPIRTKTAGDSYWTKFQRLQKLLQDPSLVACVKCNDLVPKEKSSAEDSTMLHPDEHQLCCPSCGHCFCEIHGDAHPGQSCQEYLKKHQLSKSEQAIRHWTKPCSHCSAPIEKVAGCNHIICTACNEDMCFSCGTHLYLSGEMVRSCQQCQQSYLDHRYMWRYRMTLCLSLPLYIPLLLVHVVVTGAMAILTCGCFCCLGCGVEIEEQDVSMVSFHPAKGTRAVLDLIFLPAVELIRQCGATFGCGGAEEEDVVPSRERGGTATTSDSPVSTSSYSDGKEEDV